jgi:hypothetical protein
MRLVVEGLRRSPARIAVVVAVPDGGGVHRVANT